MAVLPIVEVPDPRLRLVSKPVETIDDTTRAFVADMIETMYDAHGIGLAAIQVGVDQRILVIDLQEETKTDEDGKETPIRDPRAYINPEILSVSDETKVYNEGCLSIPEQYAEVARPAACRVRWQDETGASFEEDLDGLLSTCMQHEIDHLNGVLFTDHISRLKRDMVMKKLAKMRRAG
ncbi:peptide deformylase [Sphingomonas sp. PB2P19]|uniref:peptide deformylase n=1 Tax=Sphingomonas rhamnosi TaxID=3096156 RepID=UPI002FCC481E